jgi:hypothetical protein
MLNACVGFSSAPFYLPEIDCNKSEPTENCKTLKKSTSIMYSVELIGSLLMVIHGLLIIAIVDYIKYLPLIRFVHRLTKCLLVCYGILILMRIILYVIVRS